MTDEATYQRDMASGDPWAREMSLAERRQEHVERLAARLAAALIASPSVEPTEQTCRDACEEGLTLAREIIRQNREPKP